MIKENDLLPSGSSLQKANSAFNMTARAICKRHTHPIRCPGAFTPTVRRNTCQAMCHSQTSLEQGVQSINYVSVNDAFVMKAWGDHLGLEKSSVIAMVTVNIAKP